MESSGGKKAKVSRFDWSQSRPPSLSAFRLADVEIALLSDGRLIKFGFFISHSDPEGLFLRQHASSQRFV